MPIIEIGSMFFRLKVHCIVEIVENSASVGFFAYRYKKKMSNTYTFKVKKY